MIDATQASDTNDAVSNDAVLCTMYLRWSYECKCRKRFVYRSYWMLVAVVCAYAAACVDACANSQPVTTAHLLQQPKLGWPPDAATTP